MHALLVIGAFVRRDWRTSVSYRANFALDILGTVLTLTLFFYLGRLVDAAGATERAELAHGYFSFAAIGLAVLGLATTGVTSLASKVRQEQTTGTLETLLFTPQRRTVLILGSTTFEFIRAAITSLSILVLAAIVFGLAIEATPAAVAAAAAALAVSVGLFAALGIAVAAFTVVFKQTQALVSIVVPAVALFSGVYFPIDVLPEPLRLLAAASPFAWALDVLRSALLEGVVAGRSLTLLVIATGLALPLSLMLFSGALRHARRVGSLAQY